MTFIAEEVREILAKLGCRSLDEVIGRTELLRQVSRGAEHLDDLDLNPILAKVDAPDNQRRSHGLLRNPVPDSLDAQILSDAKPLFERGERMQLTYNVRNTHRAVGTRLSAEVTRQVRHERARRQSCPGPPARHRGPVARRLPVQRHHAWKCSAMPTTMSAKACRAAASSCARPCRARWSASTTASSATPSSMARPSGTLLAAGQAGERFAVRNSGAKVVVEGCGANGCEYMTGGVAVILGPVGSNFGAGMTGGMAFILDTDGQFERRANAESIVWQRIDSAHWEGVVKDLVEDHAKATGSKWSSEILADWDRWKDQFWQVCPKEMLSAPRASAERCRGRGGRGGIIAKSSLWRSHGEGDRARSEGWRGATCASPSVSRFASCHLPMAARTGRIAHPVPTALHRKSHRHVQPSESVTSLNTPPLPNLASSERMTAMTRFALLALPLLALAAPLPPPPPTPNCAIPSRR